MTYPTWFDVAADDFGLHGDVGRLERRVHQLQVHALVRSGALRAQPRDRLARQHALMPEGGGSAAAVSQVRVRTCAPNRRFWHGACVAASRDQVFHDFWC